MPRPQQPRRANPRPRRRNIPQPLKNKRSARANAKGQVKQNDDGALVDLLSFLKDEGLNNGDRIVLDFDEDLLSDIARACKNDPERNRQILYMETNDDELTVYYGGGR